MRVLHVRNCRGIETLTGPETYLCDLAKYTSAEMKLAISMDPNRPCEIFAESLRRVDADFDLLPVKSPFDRSDYKAIRAELETGDYDILFTHDYRSDAIGWALRKKFDIPWIAFAHGWVNWDSVFSKDRLYAWIEVATVRRADRIFVASSHMHQQLLERKFPADRISRANYGIDTERFQPLPAEPIREEFGIALDAPLVGIVGRLHPWKGHTFLLKAIADLVGEFPNLRLMIVGDAAFEAHGDFRQELVDEVAELGLNDHVIFTGSRSDIPEIMSALDIFAIPSLVEPFGIVSIEAQACGTPVVGAKVGGIPETMAEGETGLLVPPKDADALRDSIGVLLRDPDKRRKMGEGAHDFVEKNYSAPAMAKKTDELYADVLAAHSQLD
ncbi:MAG: glycosyltransferase involved in cell wall biosynthesis [Verrucomicrobiales bacterium]|jgi:glycosyltransferase involved in cell wall biosynthesis